MDHREKNRRRLASFFGHDLAPNLISALEICEELEVPLYVLKSRIRRGEFPQPDYVAPRSMRAWHIRTLKNFDLMLAVKILARRNLLESLNSRPERHSSPARPDSGGAQPTSPGG